MMFELANKARQSSESPLCLQWLQWLKMTAIWSFMGHFWNSTWFRSRLINQTGNSILDVAFPRAKTPNQHCACHKHWSSATGQKIHLLLVSGEIVLLHQVNWLKVKPKSKDMVAQRGTPHFEGRKAPFGPQAQVTTPNRCQALSNTKWSW